MKARYLDQSPKAQDLYGVRGVLEIPYPLDAEGNRVCRWCHGALPVRRRSWCSDECFQEYRERGGHWPSVQKAIYRRDRLTCQECGQRDPYVPLEVDHILPVVLGGDDRLENLRLLCVPCHRKHTSELQRQRRTG